MPRKKKEKPNLNLPVPVKRDKSIFEESEFSTTESGTETLQPATTSLVKDTEVRGVPESVYETVSSVSETKALPGITVGTDVPLEVLSKLEDEIYRILSESHLILTIRGIKSKLKGDFSEVSEEEVERSVTDLISQGLVVEVTSGKFQAVQTDEFTAQSSKGKRKTGKAGKTFRNLFARSKKSGSALMGHIRTKGSKAGKTVGGIGVGVGIGVGKFAGAKAPYVGGEARERRTEESKFWESRYEGAGVGLIPPSMRKQARKDLKGGYKDSTTLERDLDLAGIPRQERRQKLIWDEKKKKMVPGPEYELINKPRAQLRKDLLEHQLMTKRTQAAINVAEFGQRESKKLIPGRIRGSLETAGQVGVIASKGGVALAKQFSNAPRLSRVTGLTGSDSPITYAGSGASRLRAATIGARPLGTVSPQSIGGGSRRIDPFPRRDRISPGGNRIPLFGAPGSSGRLAGVSRRGPGTVRSRRLY